MANHLWRVLLKTVRAPTPPLVAGPMALEVPCQAAAVWGGLSHLTSALVIALFSKSLHSGSFQKVLQGLSQPRLCLCRAGAVVEEPAISMVSGACPPAVTLAALWLPQGGNTELVSGTQTQTQFVLWARPPSDSQVCSGPCFSKELESSSEPRTAQSRAAVPSWAP